MGHIQKSEHSIFIDSGTSERPYLKIFLKWDYLNTATKPYYLWIIILYQSLPETKHCLLGNLCNTVLSLLWPWHPPFFKAWNLILCLEFMANSWNSDKFSVSFQSHFQVLVPPEGQQSLKGFVSLSHRLDVAGEGVWFAPHCSWKLLAFPVPRKTPSLDLKKLKDLPAPFCYVYRLQVMLSLFLKRSLVVNSHKAPVVVIPEWT